MNAKSKVKISPLEKRIRERVERAKRGKEAFKGTLASVSLRASSKEPEEQPTENERELTSKENTSFEVRLRERINSSSAPFKGSLASRL
jgi:hypothetical protein